MGQQATAIIKSTHLWHVHRSSPIKKKPSKWEVNGKPSKWEGDEVIVQILRSCSSALIVARKKDQNKEKSAFSNLQSNKQGTCTI